MRRQLVPTVMLVIAIVSSIVLVVALGVRQYRYDQAQGVSAAEAPRPVNRFRVECEDWHESVRVCSVYDRHSEREWIVVKYSAGYGGGVAVAPIGGLR